MTETATKIDPTAGEVRNFLFMSEGGEDGVYYDDKNNGYPTHGIGVRLDEKMINSCRITLIVFIKGQEKLGIQRCLIMNILTVFGLKQVTVRFLQN